MPANESETVSVLEFNFVEEPSLHPGSRSQLDLCASRPSFGDRILLCTSGENSWEESVL